MREIKFRAWDKRENELLKPQTIEFLIVSNLEHRIIKDFELMQYTGIKDKNGVDIYEGDIVTKNIREKGKLVHFVVKYIHTCFMLDDCNNNRYNISKYNEVIGNIYENKELL